MRTKSVNLSMKHGQLILINGMLIQGDIHKVKLKQSVLSGVYGDKKVSKKLSEGYWK